MIFHEIYGSYFNAIAKVLSAAVKGNLDRRKIMEITEENAFGESIVTIPDALMSGRWPLIDKNFHTPVKNTPTMPLSTLQKMWMKAILQDPRVRLFSPSEEGLEDVPPLFDKEFFVYFDQYTDGDPFEEPLYMENFRKIWIAVRDRRQILICYHGKGGRHKHIVIPDKIEYSLKDDKFRLAAYSEDGTSRMINIGRVKYVKLMETADHAVCAPEREKETLVMELKDERNALERAMLHFSDLEKETVRLDDVHYRISLKYQKEDETELLIRILSFGPVLKVTEPDYFVELIKERLLRQQGFGIQNQGKRM